MRYWAALAMVAAIVAGQATFTKPPPSSAAATPAPSIQVAAGGQHSLVLKSDGIVWSFGYNNWGQLGSAASSGSREANPVPGQVMTDASALAAGAIHSLVLKSDGTVWSFGHNGDGQLGTNTADNPATGNPVPVRVMTDASAIAAGGTHSLVLKSDGTVWSFGYNFSGQLGTDTNSYTTSANPVPVQVMTGASAIAAGDAHSLVLKLDGTVWSFGDNSWGQLGTPTNSGFDWANPVPVQVMTDASSIAAGDAHSLVLKSDGTVWSFGYNSKGQLGSTTNVSSGVGPGAANPVPVQVMTDASAISAGYLHSLVLKSDGIVWSFGGNHMGQLGITTNSGGGAANPVPVQVMTDASAVDANGNHSLVLKPDGTVWAFGENNRGQLGTTTNSETLAANPTPTPVDFSGAPICRAGDTNCDGVVRVAVVGDSYISGEGAFEYETGTDRFRGRLDGGSGVSNCHRSTSSWAYRFALEITERSNILFTACSGAVASDVLDSGQSPETSQLSQLVAAGNEGAPFDVVLFSLGGNDADFSKLITQCTATFCLRLPGFRQSAAGKARQAAEKAAKVVNEIRSAGVVGPDARFYWMGYPGVVSARTPQCGALGAQAFQIPLLLTYVGLAVQVGFGGGRLDHGERRWATEFVTTLNSELKLAADETGVRFINPLDWFAGHEVCTTDAYANGFNGGEEIPDIPGPAFGVVGAESFHPNVEGHGRLLENARTRILSTLSIPNPPKAPQGIIDTVPDEVGLFIDADGSIRYWGQGVTIQTGGSPGEVIAVGMYSLPFELGRSRVGADRSARITAVVPDGLYPGWHRIDVYNVTKNLIIGSGLVLVAAPSQCVGVSPDVDNDGLLDSCDANDVDGPGADPDLDGIANSIDNCELVANPDQLAGLVSGVGAACGEAAGYDLIARLAPSLSTTGVVNVSTMPGSRFAISTPAQGDLQPATRCAGATC